MTGSWTSAARWIAGLVVATLAFGSGGSAQNLAGQPHQVVPAIRPMTRIAAGGVGYLADPQPVHLAPTNQGRLQILSGTTRAIVQCAYPIAPGCFSWHPLTIDVGALGARIAAAGATVTNFQNIDLFQDDAGGWHAAVAIGVDTPKHREHWTVTVHAHPTVGGAADAAPRSWSADTVLAGSFGTPAEGNYDGKYFEDGGRLYLLYVENIAPAPALRNAIVIQPMRTPLEPEPIAPTMLLAPGDRNGSLSSERYARTQAALVEAPYITRIDGKYALVYSAGAYLTPGYKAGVAWSDTLLPPPGGRYRKVLWADPRNLWGNPGGLDVRYLIQSQRPRWPNFTGGQVIGPGVAAAVRGPQGAIWLYFNGFAPNDMPPGPGGKVDGDHRRPFFLRLRAAIPQARSVSQASDAELAGWLQPEVR